MYDVWDVIGLSGTGTDSYSVENLFIPEKFAALRDDVAALREKGPLYRITTYTMFGLGFAAISLGVARAMLDAATDLARGKASVGQKAMRENNAVQGLIGRTEGNLARGARLYLWDRRPRSGRDVAAHRQVSPRNIAWRFGWPRPGPFIRPPRWSIPPITWRAPPPCSGPTRSNAASATCMPSRSRSRPATPITKTSAGRLLSGSPVARGPTT